MFYRVKFAYSVQALKRGGDQCTVLGYGFRGKNLHRFKMYGVIQSSVSDFFRSACSWLFLNRSKSDLLRLEEEALAFYLIYLAHESVQNAAS